MAAPSSDGRRWLCELPPVNEVKLGVVLGVLVAACASPSASGPAAGSAAAAKPPSVAEYGEIGPYQKARGPTTDADILKKLGESASRVPPGKTAQRITIGDVGYPGSVGQARAMGGMAVVLITAVTRDPGELPIARALARGEGFEADLPMLAFRASAMADVGSPVARTFGLHRYDGLYLVPQPDVVEAYCLKEFPLLTTGTWTRSPLLEGN